MNYQYDDGYDGLRVCALCGDRYTRGDVCHVCAQQCAIDGVSIHDAIKESREREARMFFKGDEEGGSER